MKHSLNGIWFRTTAIMLATTLAGCGDADEWSAAADESLGTVEQAVKLGWTPWTSDELPPVTCDDSSLMRKAGFSGDYADNVRLYCKPTTGTRGVSYWTGYFSEEDGAEYCDSGYWIAGLACDHDYCDNVSVQCVRMENITAKNCHWTGWASEEDGTLEFGVGHYAKGAQCNHDYCDNMRFYVCEY